MLAARAGHRGTLASIPDCPADAAHLAHAAASDMDPASDAAQADCDTVAARSVRRHPAHFDAVGCPAAPYDGAAYAGTTDATAHPTASDCGAAHASASLDTSHIYGHTTLVGRPCPAARTSKRDEQL